MSFCKKLVFGAALISGCASLAQAQLGIYGIANGQRFGGITCPAFAAPCAVTSGRITPYGGTIGAFYDFRNLGPARLGVDVRGDILTSNKRADSSAGGTGIVRQYSPLAGLRATFRTPISWLHPYAEIAGGYIRNNASGTYTTTSYVNNTVTPSTTTTSVSFNPAVYNNYGVVKGIAGADVRILPYLDVRVIELGIGEAIGSATTIVSTTNTTSATGTTTSSTVNSTSGSGHGVQSIGAGVVLRFGSR